jgi:hypothetical protein
VVVEGVAMLPQSAIQFSAILFTALSLVPALAHVMELPNKMRLPRESYLTVQSIYRGWALVGVLVVGALVSTFLLMRSVQSPAFAPAVIAFSCIAATQVVFWALTFPVNHSTRNWTRVTGDFRQLRRRWEYSHALSAGLNLIALVCVALAVVVERA